MTTSTLTEKLTKTEEGMRLYQQERAILELTELVCQLMHEQDLSRAELARCLGKTKGYVTQLLDGRTNMTVRTISDVFTALGRAVHFQDGSLSATVTSVPILSVKPAWSEHIASWPEQLDYRLQWRATRMYGKLVS
ncbi:MAG: helix-turn-helix transcriptional regulator [Phycisphaerae bacterium]